MTIARKLGRIGATCAIAVLATAARADTAEPQPRGFLSRMLARAEQALDEQVAARVPAPQPPHPIVVTWRARRLASIDLGAPLLDLAAGDLDGDGRAEVVALTTREVIVLAARGTRELAAVARIPLPGEPPVIEPRDPVGAVVVARAPAQIWARASTSGRGARYALVGGALREIAPQAGFPWCVPQAGEREKSAELVLGRDYFGGDGPARVYAVRCRDDLVDASGRALAAVATLGASGELDVAIRTRCAAGDGACPPERRVQVPGTGVAFAIADVDRDGRPELITSGDGAPGTADQVSVYVAPDGGGAVGKPVYRKKFTGGVAGLVAADLDGDGDLEVVAAVRLAGATKVDLWLLD